MKNLSAVLAMVLAWSVLLAACSPLEKVSRQPDLRHPVGTSELPAEDATKSATATSPAAEKADLDSIKQHLKHGLTQEEVRQLLGDHFIPVKSAKDNRLMWRYDIGAKEGYQSPDDQYDTVDVEGIRNGKLELIVFVAWTRDGKVDSFSIYYLNENDGNVYDYRTLPNGEIKEQAI